MRRTSRSGVHSRNCRLPGLGNRATHPVPGTELATNWSSTGILWREGSTEREGMWWGERHGREEG